MKKFYLLLVVALVAFMTSCGGNKAESQAQEGEKQEQCEKKDGCKEGEHKCCKEGEEHKCCQEGEHKCCKEGEHKCCKEGEHKCCKEGEHKCCHHEEAAEEK